MCALTTLLLCNKTRQINKRYTDPKVIKLSLYTDTILYVEKPKERAKKAARINSVISQVV
jgi:hypothetical protein